MERQPKNELVEIIDRTIADFLASSEPTAREVAEAVIDGNRDLIRAFGESLAILQVREIIYGRMKRAAEIGRYEADQWELPFEIEDIPPALSFEVDCDDGTETRYVSLGRATEVHIQAYRTLLRRNIANASKNLKAIDFLHDTLSPVFASHPGITVREACSILKSPPSSGGSYFTVPAATGTAINIGTQGGHQ